MKPIWRYGSAAALVLIMSLSVSSSAIAQTSAAKPDWKVLVWENFQFSKGKVSRSKNKIVSGSAEINLGGTEAGKLVYVTDALSQIPRAGGKVGTLFRRINSIVIIDLNDQTADGYRTTTYKATYTEPDSNIHVDRSSQIKSAQFSPDGRFLMLGVEFDYTARFPLILDTQTDVFRGVATLEGRMVTPSGVGLTWSPDGEYISYFDPLDDDTGSGMTMDGLSGASVPRVAFAQDWRTADRGIVAWAQGLTSPLVWLNTQTLLYGALPQENDELYGIRGTNGRNFRLEEADGKLPRPNIYSDDVAKRKRGLAIKDGYQPYPSPDGSLIAFFGSRDPDKPQPLYVEKKSPLWLWRYYCNGASLCVAKADGSHRIAFQPYHGLYPRIQWLPDNRRFVTIERTRGGPQFEAEVTLWDTQTQSFKKLATLKATTVEKPVNATEIAPKLAFPFSPAGASKDGKRIYVQSVSFPARDPKSKSDSLPIQIVVQSIDVESGQVETIAKVKNANGMDWMPQ